MSTIASIVVRIGADISSLQKQLQGAQKTLKSTGDKLTSVGKSLTLGITAPIVGIGAAALKASTDFDAAMANVSTMIGGNVKLTQQFKGQIQDLAVQMGQSTDDLANGLYNVLSAGVPASGAMTVLAASAKAANAGLTDTNTAVDVITSALHAYGEKASQASKVSDTLLKTVQLGKTTFPELAQSIGLVMPTASSLHVSFSDLNSSIAALTLVGLHTPEAITGINQALLNILKPSSQAEKEAKKLGLQFNAQALQAKGLVPFLEEIKQKTGGNANAMGQLFGSAQGLNAMMALMSSTGMSKLISTQKQMKDAAGATNTMFNAQTKGVNKTGFQMKKFKEQLQVTAQKLGDGLAPALSKTLTDLQPFLNFITKIANGFSHLSPGMQTAILAILGIGAVVGPLLVVIGTMISTISTLSTVFTVLLGPVGIVIAIIAALAVVAILIIKHWSQISGFFTSLWNGVVRIFSNVFHWISSTISSVWNSIKNVTTTVWNAITNFFRNWWKLIVLIMLPGIGYLIILIHDHWNQIKAKTQQIWNAVKGFLQGVWNGIKSVAQAVWTPIKNYIVQPMESVYNSIVGVWDRIHSRLLSTWNGIKSTASHIWSSIKDAIVAPFEHIHIPLPHFSFTKETKKFAGISVPVPVPHVSWYANGGLFNGASIIGIGEAGPEAAIPLSGSAMRPFAQTIAGEMGGGAGAGGDVYIPVNLDGRQIALVVGPHLRDIINGRTGKKI